MREDSMVSQIARLDLGQSVARAERLPPGDTFSAETLAVKADKLADILRPAASRATLKTGNRYVVETHYHVSRARSVLICGVVTRTS